jgi:hypothetical protein
MRYVLMVILITVTCFDPHLAQATDPERESLLGLPGVGVVVEEIAADVQADGLSKEEMRIAIELVLRSSGIRVLTEPERFATESSPYLDVMVIGYKDALLYSLCVEVQLRQIVSLTSRPNQKMFVPTWSRNSLVSIGANKLRDVISGSIEPKAKEFANDFLTVNPK